VFANCVSALPWPQHGASYGRAGQIVSQLLPHLLSNLLYPIMIPLLLPGHQFHFGLQLSGRLQDGCQHRAVRPLPGPAAPAASAAAAATAATAPAAGAGLATPAPPAEGPGGISV
jgi:hypothetical protein